jgi:hypothetical protein
MQQVSLKFIITSLLVTLCSASAQAYQFGVIGQDCGDANRLKFEVELTCSFAQGDQVGLDYNLFICPYLYNEDQDSALIHESIKNDRSELQVLVNGIAVTPSRADSRYVNLRPGLRSPLGTVELTDGTVIKFGRQMQFGEISFQMRHPNFGISESCDGRSVIVEK